MAICHTRDNSHESLEYGDLSYDSLEYIHLSCKCLGKRSIYHPSIQLFRQQLTKVFACPWKFSWAQLLNNHFLALMVAARNKILCIFWYLDFCIFHHAPSLVGMNTAICRNMLNCWPSTPISRLPASQAAQAAHFPGASTGLDSEVGLNGPRNCPFGEPSSNIGQLPPGKMGRQLAILSVASVATWQVSVDLKAHRTKQLDGLEQVCQCVWSPWKKEPACVLCS